MRWVRQPPFPPLPGFVHLGEVCQQGGGGAGGEHADTQGDPRKFGAARMRDDLWFIHVTPPVPCG